MTIDLLSEWPSEPIMPTCTNYESLVSNLTLRWLGLVTFGLCEMLRERDATLLWLSLIWRLHCYGKAARLDTCFFHQLRVSIGHHELVSINTTPHRETWFLLELGWTRRAHDYNRRPPWPGFEPMFSWLRARWSTTTLSSTFADLLVSVTGVFLSSDSYVRLHATVV